MSGHKPFSTLRRKADVVEEYDALAEAIAGKHPVVFMQPNVRPDNQYSERDTGYDHPLDPRESDAAKDERGA